MQPSIRQKFIGIQFLLGIVIVFFILSTVLIVKFNNDLVRGIRGDSLPNLKHSWQGAEYFQLYVHSIDIALMTADPQILLEAKKYIQNSKLELQEIRTLSAQSMDTLLEDMESFVMSSEGMLTASKLKWDDPNYQKQIQDIGDFRKSISDRLENIKKLHETSLIEQLTKLGAFNSETASQLTMIISLICLIVIIMLFYVLFTTLSRIKALGNHFSRTDVSNIEPIEGLQSGDEIGKLIAVANEMLIKIKESRQQLVFSSKMVTLGETASGVAHEINNPLSIISGNIYRIKTLLEQKDYNIPQEMVEYLDKIVHHVQRIHKITKSLYFFSRHSNGDESAKESLAKIVLNTLDLCDAKFRLANIEVITKGLDLEAQVFCKSEELSQVVLNLLNNAHDAVKDSDPRQIIIEMTKNETKCQLKISDTGPGVPKDIREKIFTPFFTTKSSEEGTGLGLSISKKIIADCKGEFFLAENESRTCFQINLPLAEDKAHSYMEISI